MTEIWKCSECHTVNNGHHGRCIACNAKMTPLAAPAGHEEATTKVRTVSPAGPTFPRPPSRVVISSPPRSAPPPDPPRFPPPAGSSTRPPTGPGPGSSPPSLPGRVGRSRSRSFATGRFLGIGHIGLFTTALLLALSELAWGRAALSWAYHPTIARDVASWQANSIIHAAASWSNALPWGTANWPYLLLALACLVMRLTRRMPGPLSLVIGLPAALYGVLIGVAELPAFAALFPLAIAAFIVSCITVAKTRR